MSKQTVKFIKGSYDSYDKDKLQGAIYFAEDEEQIIVNGIEYGGSDNNWYKPKENQFTFAIVTYPTKEFSMIDNIKFLKLAGELEQLQSLEGTGRYIPLHLKIDFGDGTIEEYNSNDNIDDIKNIEEDQSQENTDKIFIRHTYKEEKEYKVKFTVLNPEMYSSDLYNELFNYLKEGIGDYLPTLIPVSSVSELDEIKEFEFKEYKVDGIKNNTYNFINITDRLQNYITITFETKLILDDKISNIGDVSFMNLTNLTGELIIPESVTSIGVGAFAYCSGFTGELIIPESVTSIGQGAFAYCSGFTGELIIPESVTSIGIWAFNGCSGFTGDLIIPESVTSIGREAFYNCSGFTGELIIPESVTYISEWAFENCTGFTGELIIPEKVTSIGDGAFAGCTNLSKIYVCEDTVLEGSWNDETPAEVITYKKGETPWIEIPQVH